MSIRKVVIGLFAFGMLLRCNSTKKEAVTDMTPQRWRECLTRALVSASDLNSAHASKIFNKPPKHPLP